MNSRTEKIQLKGAAGAIDLRPTIAVMPIALRSVEPEHRFLGEALADEVTAALSKTAELHVISRLSSFAFLDRKAGLPEIGARLNARYVLSGSVGAVDDRLRLHLELADAVVRILVEDCVQSSAGVRPVAVEAVFPVPLQLLGRCRRVSRARCTRGDTTGQTGPRPSRGKCPTSLRPRRATRRA